MWVHVLLPLLSGKLSCNPQARDLILQLVERLVRVLFVPHEETRVKVPGSECLSQMRFSTEPKGCSCAALRHTSALLPILPDSYFLNNFSSEIIAERAPVPITARLICEGQTISVVPATRVTMVHCSRSFSFYIIGYSREVYLKDYCPSQFC